MLYIYLPVLYYHDKLQVTEGAYTGGRGFPLAQWSFLLFLVITLSWFKLGILIVFRVINPL